MGELHLDVIKDRLLREFNVEANVGEPRVSYRESLEEPITIEETFQQEIEGKQQFAAVTIKFEPYKSEEPLLFESQISDGELPEEYIRAVSEALTEGVTGGALYGYPLIDVKATLVDGRMDPATSTPIAFEAAASRALRHALEKGGCQLLEPVMRLEIVAPEDYMGEVISYVNTCRGEISEVDTRDHLRVIRAFAPLAELFGFTTQLRSATQGRGSCTMEPWEYRPAPEQEFA